MAQSPSEIEKRHRRRKRLRGECWVHGCHEVTGDDGNDTRCAEHKKEHAAAQRKRRGGEARP